MTYHRWGLATGTLTRHWGWLGRWLTTRFWWRRLRRLRWRLHESKTQLETVMIRKLNGTRLTSELGLSDGAEEGDSLGIELGCDEGVVDGVLLGHTDGKPETDGCKEGNPDGSRESTNQYWDNLKCDRRKEYKDGEDQLTARYRWTVRWAFTRLQQKVVEHKYQIKLIAKQVDDIYHGARTFGRHCWRLRWRRFGGLYIKCNI